jgi:poly(3-hydroxybutyrate) depolymerase
MSAESHRDWWIRANRAQGNGVREEALPDASPDDGCRIYRTLHPAQTGGAPVLFLKVQGGGHALPSRTHTLPDNAMVRRLIGPVCRDAEGAELAWEFMSRYQR